MYPIMVITIDSCDSSMGGPSILRMLRIAKLQFTKVGQFSKQNKHADPVHHQANKKSWLPILSLWLELSHCRTSRKLKSKTPQVAK